MSRFYPVLTALFCLIFSCCPLNSQPQELIETGLQPLALVPDGEQLHVFCNRLDLDFNGAQDEGDLPFRWYVIDAGSLESELVREFAWDDAPGFPFRPAIDETTQRHRHDDGAELLGRSDGSAGCVGDLGPAELRRRAQEDHRHGSLRQRRGGQLDL